MKMEADGNMLLQTRHVHESLAEVEAAVDMVAGYLLPPMDEVEAEVERLHQARGVLSECYKSWVRRANPATASLPSSIRPSSSTLSGSAARGGSIRDSTHESPVLIDGGA